MAALSISQFWVVFADVINAVTDLKEANYVGALAAVEKLLTDSGLKVPANLETDVEAFAMALKSEDLTAIESASEKLYDDLLSMI